MNVFAHVEGLIKTALESLQADGELPAEIDLASVEAEAPRDKGHGDLATNAALVLAKKAKMKPRDIAEKALASIGPETSSTAVSVKVGCSIFPKEIFRSSERWCKARFPSLVHYNALEKGGHFAAFEQPETFVDEVRTCMRHMRQG